MNLVNSIVSEYLSGYRGWDDFLEEPKFRWDKSITTTSTSTNAKSYEAEIEREKNSKMKTNKKVYYVTFENSKNSNKKEYAYYSDVPLTEGAVYDILVDGRTSYNSFVKVTNISYYAPQNITLRTITEATMITGAPVPPDEIKNVIFNQDKRTTVVMWEDGEKTIVHMQEGDDWDEEKALAMCYMKKALGNRGSFNNTLRKWCNKNER